MYAAYLAQYQIQQGINPYEGMYDGMGPYGNPAMYGPGGAAVAAAGSPSAPMPPPPLPPPPPAPSPTGAAPTGAAVAARPTHSIPSLPGVTGKTPAFAVTAAAAAAIAAATRSAAVSGEKRPPKENEEAKQVKKDSGTRRSAAGC